MLNGFAVAVERKDMWQATKLRNTSGAIAAHLGSAAIICSWRDAIANWQTASASAIAQPPLNIFPQLR